MRDCSSACLDSSSDGRGNDVTMSRATTMQHRCSSASRDGLGRRVIGQGRRGERITTASLLCKTRASIRGGLRCDHRSPQKLTSGASVSTLLGAHARCAVLFCSGPAAGVGACPCTAMCVCYLGEHPLFALSRTRLETPTTRLHPGRRRLQPRHGGGDALSALALALAGLVDACHESGPKRARGLRVALRMCVRH